MQFLARSHSSSWFCLRPSTSVHSNMQLPTRGYTLGRAYSISKPVLMDFILLSGESESGPHYSWQDSRIWKCTCCNGIGSRPAGRDIGGECWGNSRNKGRTYWKTALPLENSYLDLLAEGEDSNGFGSIRLLIRNKEANGRLPPHQ